MTSCKSASTLNQPALHSLHRPAWLIRLALIVSLAALVYLPHDAHAQSRTRVVAYSGEEAPGTSGATFSSSLRPLGISDTGKLVFHAFLEGGDTQAGVNDEGLWIQENGAVRLLARLGDPVPELSGFSLINSLGGGSSFVQRFFLDLAGNVAFVAEVSNGVTSQDAFFVEENNVLVVKITRGMATEGGLELFRVALNVLAFNQGRVLLIGTLDGAGANAGNNVALMSYDPAVDPNTLSFIAREGDVMDGVAGGFVYDDSGFGFNRSNPLGPQGDAIIQMEGRVPGSQDRIRVLYRWSGSERKLTPIASSDTTQAVFAEARLNSSQQAVFQGLVAFPSTEALWHEGQQAMPVATEGDAADGAQGLAFEAFNAFGLFDDGRLVTQAQLTNNAGGIWMEDATGALRSVAQVGSPAPGVGQGMVFGRVNNMAMSHSGQVAFFDLTFHPTTFAETSGLWMGDLSGLTLVIARGAEIEVVAPGDTLKVEDPFLVQDGNLVGGARTGADGHPTEFSGQGELLFGVLLMNNRGSAILVASSGLVVNSVGDDPDENDTDGDGIIAGGEQSDGACDTGNMIARDDGSQEKECTLRAAITEANAIAGEDQITYDIPTTVAGYDPSTETWTIAPDSELPEITDDVTIDASRPDISTAFSAKSAPPMRCGTVRLDGRGMEKNGLVLTRGSSKLGGFYAVNYKENGILIKSSGNTITGACIGTDNGTRDNGNQQNGIFIDGTAQNASDNIIGGSKPGMGNIISGNDANGILIKGKQAKGNRVEGNFIGTKISGTDALGNEKSGVRIEDAPENIIGGLISATTRKPGSGAGNVIRSNKEFGILITGKDAKDNFVRGNLIGDPEEEDLLNAKRGIVVSGGASGTVIGGETPELVGFRRFGNEIYDGISITGSDTKATTVSRNNWLEIPADWMKEKDLRVPLDLGEDGPSCNPWTGGQGTHRIAPPRILSFSTTQITGMTQPNAEVEIFFVQKTGEKYGRYFARAVERVVTTKADAKGYFMKTLDDSFPEGSMVAVTATDEAGNTSELSQLKRPIIAVPGIGGSWLEAPNGDNLWIPEALSDLNNTRNDRLALLALLPNGITGVTRVSVDGVVETVFGKNAAYGHWLEALQDAGYKGEKTKWLDPDGQDSSPGNELTTDLWRLANDWRLNQAGLASNLRDQIDYLTSEFNEEVARSCEVDLLSHSNGGVITSTYVRTHTAHSRDHVHRLLEMAVPYWGAARGLQIHTMGYVFGLESEVGFLHAITSLIPGGQVVRSFDPDWGRIIEMLRNIPAGYALIPSEKYWEASGQILRGSILPDLFGKPLLGYQATKDFLTKPKVVDDRAVGLGRNKTLFNIMEKNVSQQIGDWSEWEGPPHIFRISGNVRDSLSTPIGFGVAGIASFRETHPDEWRMEPGDSQQHLRYRTEMYIHLGRGDTTVPLSSATLGRKSGKKDLSGVMVSGSNNRWIEDFQIFPCTHLGLVADECVDAKELKSLDRMVQIFKDGYLARAVPASGSTFDMVSTVSAHQDVFYIYGSGRIGVHVTDSEGNHTGPSSLDSFRDIEYSIPDLGYFPNEFAVTLSLPRNETYTVTVRAPETASDVRVVRLITDGDAANRNVLFPDQPLAKAGAIQVTLTSGTAPESTTFDVDADGDGNFEGILSPSVSFTSDFPAPAVPVPEPFFADVVAYLTDTEDRKTVIALPSQDGPQWSWEARATADWITPKDTSGTTPGSLELTLASLTLPTGTYEDTLEVSVQFEGYEIDYPVIVQLRILESSELTSIEISPAFATVGIGQDQQFTAEGFDQSDQAFGFTPLWSAISGTITADGLYTAGGEAGVDTVTVTDPSHSVSAKAVVEVGVPVSAEQADHSSIPTEFQLHASYPNPFNPVARIPFDVKSAQRVTLTVYDLLGRRVLTLVDEPLAPGRYEASFNARRLPSGMYLYQIVMGDFRKTRKMILVK